MVLEQRHTDPSKANADHWKKKKVGTLVPISDLPWQQLRSNSTRTSQKNTMGHAFWKKLLSWVSAA